MLVHFIFQNLNNTFFFFNVIGVVFCFVEKTEEYKIIQFLSINTRTILLDIN